MLGRTGRMRRANHWHSAHLPPSFSPFGLVLWGWGPMLVIMVILKWLSIQKHIFLYIKSSSVTSQSFVNEMSVFLQKFILQIFGTDSSSHHAFACLEACFLCFRSVQAAGGRSRSMRGRRDVSTSCKLASCPRQYILLTNVDAWVPGNACATSYVHVNRLKVQI